MIDYGRLAITPVSSDPFGWARVSGSFETIDMAALLAATFPTDGFWRFARHDGEKSFSYSVRPLAVAGSDEPVDMASLDPAWQQLTDELLSSSYREALTACTGCRLDDALVEASVWRWPVESHLGTHRDLATKILTHIFYFNVGWDPAWGGCLEILDASDSADPLAVIPPKLNSGSIVVRSDTSWHAVSPVRPGVADPRLSLLVTFYHPGSPSPAWTIDERGVSGIDATREPDAA